MKPILLKDILSPKELFFMYNQICTAKFWAITGTTDSSPGAWKTPFNCAPLLNIYSDEQIHIYPYYIWIKSIVYRIESMLEKQNKSIHTQIKRCYINITYTNSSQHSLHPDGSADETSILLFLTPIWFPEGKGAFYVEGKKFDFTPGGAVIFKSNQYHKGEPPSQKIESTNWMRLTCNILLEKK